uniref:HAT C-terminal dimerisation domain-containing protein n=1 Tax=Hordeum vulgare subsp. vulgare TaxID=112509 RepID=A0A8I6XP62_HORVV
MQNVGRRVVPPPPPPLHCLAHSCNPRFALYICLSFDNLKLSTLKGLLILRCHVNRYYSPNWLAAAPGRITPLDDNEIFQMRNKCLQKLFPDPNDHKTVKKEFADFALMMNDFQNADSIEDRDDFEPKQWWGTHGGNTKFLKSLALKLLGQPSSSSCCERNWSSYSFIHSSERNKLTPEGAEDLVFAHNNLRLLSRQSETYHVGPSRMWDVGGDGVESFTGVGMLEGANLTLDEPKLEAEIMDTLT